MDVRCPHENSTFIVAPLSYLTAIFFFLLLTGTCKGVAYRVWWFKVEGRIQEILHSHEVIAEEIRKSLQGEAKTKIGGFGPGMSVERIFEQLSMAMKGLPWETNYCPKLTVFNSKKVRKFLRSQVA